MHSSSEIINFPLIRILLRKTFTLADSIIDQAKMIKPRISEESGVLYFDELYFPVRSAQVVFASKASD